MTLSWNKIKAIFTKFKGLTIIGFANMVSNIIGGLFWLYVARLLGTEHYGEISYLIAIVNIGAIISLVGSGTTLTVYTAKGVKIQAGVYFISIVAAVITSIVLYFMFYNIGVSLFVIGNVIFSLATSELLGLKSYRKYAIYFISQRILMAGLALFLYHIIGFNGIILGLALSFFLTSFRIYQGFRETKIDFSLIRPRLRFMFNSYSIDITRIFATTVDKLLIAPLFGLAILGNYQLGVQFLVLLSMFPGIVYNYILTHDASGNPNKKLKQATIIISVALAILGVTLGPTVLPLFFPQFTHVGEIIQIMSLSVIPITINNTYISKFLGKEKNKIVLVGSGIFLAMQIIAIIVLGKIFGIYGIAFSYVLATTSEAVYLMAMDRFSRKMDQTRK